MRSTIMLAMVASLLSSPALADGAFALGYKADGSLVWGIQYGEESTEIAAPLALEHCQRQGSNCTALRLPLPGNGAWFALADDPTVPVQHRLPWGLSYSASKETAIQEALAACQQNGGTHCRIGLLKQNVHVMTTHTVHGAPNFTPPHLNPGEVYPGQNWSKCGKEFC